jgi:alpha-L-fucosidase 2
MKQAILLSLFVAFLFGCVQQSVEKSPIWYAEPAEDWKSAIPMGNGRIGGMIFGGIVEDQILINENTIWCGLPTPVDNPRGPELIAKMRRLLAEGKYGEAEELCKNEFMEGKDPSNNRSYQPFGTLQFTYNDQGTATNYLRSLDIEKAIATVSYEQQGVKYTREAFVSAPDQVLVMRITANQPEQISFVSSFERPFGSETKLLGNNIIHISGQAFDENNAHKGVQFDGLAQFVAEGGQTQTTENGIEITNANSVILFVSIATDYNISEPLKPLTENRIEICEQQINAAIEKGYEKLKSDHIADFSSLYNRSSIQIDFPNQNLQAKALPIDKRIAAVNNGSEDPDLLLTYYAYCRYVFISASRAGNLPMNLQGIWNPFMAAPWRANFHININFQEAYWFAEQANLSECHEPFFTLTENLVPSGKNTAKIMFGVDRGFATGHRTDAWFYTTPTDGHPRWGMYVIGGAWCAQHLMEHYRFAQDKTFLQNRAYPVIREAALFFVDWLVPNAEGKLVSGPTASAENAFTAPDGNFSSISMGTSQDQEMIWSTFRDYLETCRILGIENSETAEVKAAFDNLALPKIGSDGRLMEWANEYIELEPGHRHVSHLWGLMPGDRITLEKTPELAQAVGKSLDFRLANGYDAQGWSLGWVSCIMARLKQGDRAIDLISNQYFKKAYPNMFVDAHSFVQVGDMMGASLAMIEMLLQSHTETIELLPALPEKWKDGKAKGLCARGGFVFDFEWKNNELVSATVFSKVGGECNVRYANTTTKISTEAGKTYTLSDFITKK